MKNLLIILALLAGLFACDNTPTTEVEGGEATSAPHEEGDENRVELTKAQYETAGIATGLVTERSLSGTVVANGVIDTPPQNLVSISAPYGGFVRSTDLLQGKRVRKGQVVATIENPDLIKMQQDYLETASQLEYAELELARQTELSRENVNARKVLQQATADAKTQKARLAGLKGRLQIAGISPKSFADGNLVTRFPVVSPISGSVTVVNVNLGMYVNPTDVMFEIVDTEHLHVEISVFEDDVPKIKIGQTIRFTLSNDPAKQHLAKVYLINQKINEDRTVRIHGHLDHDDHGMLPNNFVRAVIETGASPVPALPEEAIVDFEGRPYIFVRADSAESRTFEMVEVARGVTENGYAQVTLPKDFDRSREVVMKGAYALLSKLKNSEEEGEGH